MYYNNIYYICVRLQKAACRVAGGAGECLVPAAVRRPASKWRWAAAAAAAALPLPHVHSPLFDQTKPGDHTLINSYVPHLS